MDIFSFLRCLITFKKFIWSFIVIKNLLIILLHDFYETLIAQSARFEQKMYVFVFLEEDY